MLPILCITVAHVEAKADLELNVQSWKLKKTCLLVVSISDCLVSRIYKKINQRNVRALSNKTLCITIATTLQYQGISQAVRQSCKSRKCAAAQEQALRPMAKQLHDLPCVCKALVRAVYVILFLLFFTFVSILFSEFFSTAKAKLRRTNPYDRILNRLMRDCFF